MSGKAAGGNVLYHERQESSLCAVHCLNTLLQAPVFTEIDLAALAQNLDKRERDVMMESGTESSHFLRFMAEDSGNVDPDGNFSVQVLSQALEVWGLSCVPLKSLGSESNLEEETAFVCNLQSHWFTIRKVNGEWYNFNSLYPAPEHLSQFYLTAYLSSLKNEGWSLFSVRGGDPFLLSQLSNNSELSNAAFGSWYTPEDAKNILLHQRLQSMDTSHPPRRALPPSLNQLDFVRGQTPPASDLHHHLAFDEAEEDDLAMERAILASLNPSAPPTSATGSPTQEDLDLAEAIRSSLAEDGK